MMAKNQETAATSRPEAKAGVEHCRLRASARAKTLGSGKSWVQFIASGVVFFGMMVACVSTEGPKSDAEIDVLGDEQLYGDITSGLDSPMWDEGERQAYRAPDNAIDRALSQSPYDDQLAADRAKFEKKSKAKASDRKLKKASKSSKKTDKVVKP